MKSSKELNELATSLTAAQSKMPAVKRAASGHRNKYATLDDIIEAVRGPLSEHGLAFVQLPAHGEKGGVTLCTRLIHESGQWLEDEYTMPAVSSMGNEAQGYGAAITYARRYALGAMLGIATEEDTDGASPQKRPAVPAKQAQAANGAAPAPTDKQRKGLHAVGVELYGDEWDSKRADMSAAFGKNSSKEWTADEVTKVVQGMRKRLQERAQEQAPLFEDEIPT